MTIIEHFNEMKSHSDNTCTNVTLKLKSKHKSSINFNREKATLEYELFISNPNIELPKIKEIDIKWCKNSLLLSSKVVFIREFGLLVQDIFDSIKTFNNSDNVLIITTIKRRINSWKQFIGRNIGNGIPFNKEIGLFGELISLKFLISQEGDEVVNNWSGPLFKSKDFELINVDIETKTSIVGQNENFIHINGIEQLYSYKELYIHRHLLVEENDGDEISDIVEEIIELLGDETRNVFIEKITALGYSPIKNTQSGRKFSVMESIFYKVEDNFPRLPIVLGIFNVEYDINIDSVRNFKREGFN